MSLKDLVEEEKRRIAAGEPEPVRRPSFVARTGQSVRLVAAKWAFILGTAALIAGWLTLKRPFGMTLLWGGVAGYAAGFAALCLSVRCPRCRVAVVWHTFKTRDQGVAVPAAFYQLSCPKCGYDPP